MQAQIIDGHIVFNVPYHLNHLPKSAGARWHSASKTWRAKANKLTAGAVMANFPVGEIDPAISELLGTSVEIKPLGIDPQDVLKGVELKIHQDLAVRKAWNKHSYAMFHVMGAGKTLSAISLFNLRREHGMVDQLLVVCPTSVKGVWPKEFDRYSNIPVDCQILESGNTVKKFEGFPMLVVGVEALSQGNAFTYAIHFVKRGRTMVIVDESSRIKNYDAIRTERCWELGEEAVHRLILTGTSVTQGLQDLYAQMRFVDPTVIGELSYYSFRNKYCVMGGFEQRKIVGYRNVEELLERIKPYCDVIRKEDMKGMPDKTYTVREVKATPAQVKACKELAREMKTTLGDKEISVQNALEAMLRFQQIAGGFEPDGTPLPTNPKMSELVALLDEFDGKALIWARYLPELNAIEAELEKNWPGSTLKMSGAVKSEDRQPMVDQFQTDPKKRFFIANQSTGGIGLTLTAATLSVYYSNTFSLEDRLQSEDRNHRIGQEYPVTYVDLKSDLKVDQMLLDALTNKKSLSEYVSGALRVDDLL
jgi:SNF2 family DNA or RNA helicase